MTSQSRATRFSKNERSETLDVIRRLIDCLVNIKDETREFLMPLEDGRIIDTKGWNDWEVCHNERLYRIGLSV